VPSPRSWLVAALLAVAAPGWAAQTFSGRVVAVHDGDTISVRTPTATVRVRLADIDCPEIGQPWSVLAKQFTSRLVFDRVVTVETRGLDQYNRVLGKVTLEGTDVNEALVRSGMAWQYTRGVGDARLAEAERAARSGRVGLWGDRSPVPPWEWRRAHREGQPPESVRPRAHTEDFSGPIDIRDARGPFHGNVHSHLYHRRGCPNYNCKGCEETFLTAESAEEAGYRPARDCLSARH
jgi:micrococcal nuclease